MLGQDRFRRLLPSDRQSRQRSKAAIVGQMLRCRNQVATSVAVKLNSKRTVVNSAWESFEGTAAAPSREQSWMGTDKIDPKGITQRSSVASGNNTKNKVEWQYCIVLGGMSDHKWVPNSKPVNFKTTATAVQQYNLNHGQANRKAVYVRMFHDV